MGGVGVGGDNCFRYEWAIGGQEGFGSMIKICNNLYTVPKVTIFRDIRRNVAGKTRYYAEYFMQYLVFLYNSCYNAEI